MTTAQLRSFFVITPPFEDIIDVVTDDGKGPTACFSDVVTVEAATPHDARVLGLRMLRNRGSQALSDEAYTCPLWQLEVEEFSPTCEQCGRQFRGDGSGVYATELGWVCNSCLPEQELEP